MLGKASFTALALVMFTASAQAETASSLPRPTVSNWPVPASSHPAGIAQQGAAMPQTATGAGTIKTGPDVLYNGPQGAGAALPRPTVSNNPTLAHDVVLMNDKLKQIQERARQQQLTDIKKDIANAKQNAGNEAAAAKLEAERRRLQQAAQIETMASQARQKAAADREAASAAGSQATESRTKIRAFRINTGR